MSFQLESSYLPCGDQPQAIAKLLQSLQAGNRHQTLLGVTGSGKTFTAANVIQELGRPTLVISHNKTLAAQLFSEFKQFFPKNAIEYFVSYFDYYQPEAYLPQTDTYIEKDSAVNAEIERLRLSTVSSLLSRKDVIVVASVSCIYGLGSPEDFLQMLLPLHVGQKISRSELLVKLVNMLYERNDFEFERGKFRVRGDTIEVHPAQWDEQALRIECFGDDIERLSEIDPLTGAILQQVERCTLFPAKQFVTPREKVHQAIQGIRQELEERVAEFEDHRQLLEAQRLKLRTEYDIQMFLEMGYCNGAENYSRHLSGRAPGSRPYTLLDFFPRDFLLIVDESHVSIPQIGGMYAADRSRKQVLVEYGFRLPSALDNRPLNFQEFMEMTGQIVYISATPGEFEMQNSWVGNQGYEHYRGGFKEGQAKRVKLQSEAMPQADSVPVLADQNILSSSSALRNTPIESAPIEWNCQLLGAPLIVEQVIRPTGLLDPTIHILPLKGQIDATVDWCQQRIAREERVLVTTLTKRTAEDLTDYLREIGLKVRYLHSDVDTLERVEILRGLRAAEFDILVGINLLREGLDLPEVSLICILDADKAGFLRSLTALVQIAGRAARHIHGQVLLFADEMTHSIQQLVQITENRRMRQMAYNQEHGIVPSSVHRAAQKGLHHILEGAKSTGVAEAASGQDAEALIQELEQEMKEASAQLEYERAALLRDQILELKASIADPHAAATSHLPVNYLAKIGKKGKSRRAKK